MTRPRLLDLFCGAGGAAVGYDRAGFDVTGVDIEPQPRYPFAFVQADALEYLAAHGDEFDAIHASPPCQAYSALRYMWNAKEHPDLLEPTRHALIATGLPFVIENVPGAPLHSPMVLCGSMFGLGTRGYQLRRHRLFELWPFMTLRPPCQHTRPVIGIYGDHVRDRGRWRTGGQFPGQDRVKLAGDALGIDWMEWRELAQAIPPAYTEYVGKSLLAAIESEAA